MNFLHNLFIPFSLTYKGYEKVATRLIGCVGWVFEELLYSPVRFGAIKQGRSWWRDVIDLTCYWLVPFLSLLIVASTFESTLTVFSASVGMYLVATSWFSVLCVSIGFTYCMPKIMVFVVSLSTMKYEGLSMQSVWEHMVYGVPYPDMTVEWRYACIRRRVGPLDRGLVV